MYENRKYDQITEITNVHFLFDPPRKKLQRKEVCVERDFGNIPIQSLKAPTPVTDYSFTILKTECSSPFDT